jgi:hypothetical protein
MFFNKNKELKYKLFEIVRSPLGLRPSHSKKKKLSETGKVNFVSPCVALRGLCTLLSYYFFFWRRASETRRLGLRPLVLRPLVRSPLGLRPSRFAFFI